MHRCRPAAAVAARGARRLPRRRPTPRLPADRDAGRRQDDLRAGRWRPLAAWRAGRRPGRRGVPDRSPADPVGRRGRRRRAAARRRARPTRSVRSGRTASATSRPTPRSRPSPRCTRPAPAAKRTLVVLDEVHHAGDGLSWGEAVAEAFERRDPSGLPDRDAVPDPRRRADPVRPLRPRRPRSARCAASADYSYGYREALRDGVVRPVVFAAYTGTSRWRNSAGEVIAASLTETQHPADRGHGLAHRAQPARAMGAARDRRHGRAHHPPARGRHRPTPPAWCWPATRTTPARTPAIVERVTGEAPVVILSDDPKASEKITEFTTGTQRMAVCVRMVSEGVDVPRAACLAWMTSYRTPLFFAQAVGRVVRSRAPGRVGDGVPAGGAPAAGAGRRTGAASATTSSRRRASRPGPARRRAAGARGRRGRSEYELVDADAAFAHVLHGGRAVVADRR